MANTKITQLPTASYSTNNDLLVIVTDTSSVATTKNIQIDDFFANISSNTIFTSNVTVNNSRTLKVGNSMGSSVITQTLVRVANSTTMANISSLGLTTGTIVANNSGFYAGANVSITKAKYFYGNSTVNTNINSILTFANSTLTANLSLVGLKIGNSTVNSIGVYIGANVVANTSTLRFGATASNTTVNSSTVMVGANVIVNSTTVSLGAETRANSTTIVVGNSTTNATVNSTSIYFTNSTSNTIVKLPNTVQYAATNMYLHANGNWNTPEEHMIIDVSRDETTSITTGTNKYVFYAPYAMTLTKIPKATLTTNSTSGSVTLDINESGVSLFSTLLTIDVNEATSVTAAVPAVLSDTTIADNAQVTIDINGAGTGAKGLKVTLYYKRT